MPLTQKGQEILSNMKEQYGPEKGEQVFYASKNAGTISGVDAGASIQDEHLGFEKLEHTLAGKPGIHDPAAVAAHIGMEKYGKKEFEHMAQHDSARDMDLPFEINPVEQLARSWGSADAVPAQGESIAGGLNWAGGNYAFLPGSSPQRFASPYGGAPPEVREITAMDRWRE